MLARINSIAVHPDKNEVFVLDPEYKKIAVFDTVGRLVRVVLGGYGEGPGEFLRPRSITFLDKERFAVADQEARRLSIFDSRGQFQQLYHLPYAQPLQILASNGRLYLRRFALTGQYAVKVFEPAGTPRDSAILIQGRYADFAEFGETGMLAHDRANEVLLVHPSVGLWTYLADPTKKLWGKELFPDSRGSINRSGGAAVRSPPFAIRGFAELGDGTRVILLARFERPPSGPTARPYVLFFDAGGSYQGFLPLPDGHMGPLTAGFGSNDVLIATHEPFPRLVRYVVERVRK